MLTAADLRQRRAALTVIGLLALLAAPATLTLYQVREPARQLLESPNPTPYGYTWSLLLFLAPALVLGTWFARQRSRSCQKRGFARTLVALVPIGFGLDFLLASWLFCFPNEAATLGLKVPILGGSAPLEEFIFYASGFLVVLLTYIWADEYWMAAYNVPDYGGPAQNLDRVVSFHLPSLVSGAGLIAAALLYKRVFQPGTGFPWYFSYLVIGAIIPSTGLFRSVRSFVNWRAFSLVLALVLWVSLLWEVTLAVPYGWWQYQPDLMLGIKVRVWSELPIEAVLVWVAVTYVTVIVFEAMKVWVASGMSGREAMTGRRSAAPA